ncbi:MAG: hypothetical protein ACT4PE_09640 [Candidatus Eiseniibacteriota bacterium]
MRSPFATVLLLAAALLPACSPNDVVEEHRRLSLRLEHRPPEKAQAGEDLEIHALITSSLEAPRTEAWVRLVGDPENEKRIAMKIASSGEAVARIAAHPRGEEIRYVIEARDAAGLVVALPKGIEKGESYRVRFEGSGSALLGAISFLSAVSGLLLYLGAGAAGAQALRGRMSAGPAGLLGATGAAVVTLGLLVVGGIHAWQITGRPWPSSPVLLALSRGDLGIVTLGWVLNLFLGRRALLDEDAQGGRRGEHPFAVGAVAAAGLTVLLLVF